jgi:hypothetical protein
MLSKEHAEIAACQINADCREAVRPFVMARADLSVEAFEIEARKHLQAMFDRSVKMRGDAWDDLDDLFVDATWKAMWRVYYQLRAAGSSAVGMA